MTPLLLLAVLAGTYAQLLVHHDSCRNRCFEPNEYSHTCQCGPDCETVGNCCGDFYSSCRGSEIGLVVTQKELDTFAQSIWDNDVNRINSALYALNFQGQYSSADHVDVAPDSLIQPTDGQLDAILADHNTTYPAFIRLLNNYAANVNHDEHRPEKEIQEENKFWDAISQTKVMQLAFHFLVDNGFIKSDMDAFRTVMNELWFELYPHKHSSLRSDSGFEHVIIGEKNEHHGNRTSTASGMNNWVQYYLQEKAGKLNYSGYNKYSQNPNAANIRFTWGDAEHHGATFFVGTSPEFDLALYSVCALTHPNKNCQFHLNGGRQNLATTVARHGQVLQVTSAALKVHSDTPASSTPTPVTTPAAVLQ